MARKIIAKEILLAVTITIILFIGFFGILKNELGQLNKIISHKNNSQDLIVNYYTNLVNVISHIDQNSNQELPFFYKIIDINGLFHKLMGEKIIYNAEENKSIILLNNGYLSLSTTSMLDVNVLTENIKSLSEFLEFKNIPLLYVQAPYKINKYDSQLPPSMEDTVNDYTDDFLELISGYVDYIDLRDEMYMDGVDHYEYFFTTDHHWKPEGAFYGFQKTAKKLIDEYGFQIPEDLLDYNNYNVTVYEDYFLGSEGKQVGTLVAGVDDISLINPKFETSYSFYNSGRDIYKEGSWLETMIDSSLIKKIDYFRLKPNEMYLNSFQLTIAKNAKMHDKKILLVIDSFGLPFATFLSLVCSEINIIDIRNYNDLTLYEYIEQNGPDLVMFCYSPHAYKTGVPIHSNGVPKTFFFNSN